MGTKTGDFKPASLIIKETSFVCRESFVKKSYPLSKFCTRSGDVALIEAINK